MRFPVNDITVAGQSVGALFNLARENQVERGQLLDRCALEQAMAQVADAIVSVIGNSGLSRSDQEQIQIDLSSIPVIIKDAARQQDKRPQAGATAEAKKRGRGRSRKRESKHPEEDQSES